MTNQYVWLVSMNCYEPEYDSEWTINFRVYRDEKDADLLIERIYTRIKKVKNIYNKLIRMLDINSSEQFEEKFEKFKHTFSSYLAHTYLKKELLEIK